MALEFRKWGKTARWGSPFDITEKLDGTNAAVLIREVTPELEAEYLAGDAEPWRMLFNELGPQYAVAAQSRTRVITPRDDNYGFARWVWDNADTLVADLGPGTHYGEWWGAKIQRAYGLTNGERYFSLFDHKRYGAEFEWNTLTPNLSLVPLMNYDDEFTMEALSDAVTALKEHGSFAHSGKFDRPEGVVVHWHHNDMRLKYILDK